MDLTEPTAEHELSLQTWRALALRRMPYLPAVLFSLRVLNAPGLGTFAVDQGHRLYVDFDHVAKTFTDDQAAQALLHESVHLLAGHADQATTLGVDEEGRRVFNIATDLSINDDLRDGGCEIFADGGRFLLPSTYDLPDYRTPAFYLDKLQQLMHQQGAGAGSGQAGEGEPQAGDGDEPYSGCGSGAGGQPAPGELPADDDFAGKAPAASSIERKRIAVETAAKITEHASRGRGKVPGGLVEWAKDVLTPSPTPWEQVLASFVRRGVAARPGPFDVDRSRRHRRRHRQTISTAEGVVVGRLVIPGTFTPTPSIEAIRDTSGSMSTQDLTVATREVVAIAKTIGIRGPDLVITDVDARAYESVQYTGASTLAKISGRGGTDMRVGIEAAVARRRRPTVIVVLTDGGTPWPADKPPIPVVVVLVGPPADTARRRAQVPTWARVVEANPSASRRDR